MTHLGSSTEKSGLVTTAHGLRIACLGGIFDENLYSVAESPHVRWIALFLGDHFIHAFGAGVHLAVLHKSHGREVDLEFDVTIYSFERQEYLVHLLSADQSVHQSE